MNRQFLLILLGSVAVIGLVVFGLVKENQATVIQLNGAVKGARLVELGDGSTLAMVDFEATNPSKIGFELNQVEIEAHVGKDTLPSTLFSKYDLENYLQFQKYTPKFAQIGLGEQIKAGETAKRMVAARFEVLMPALKDAQFVVRLTNVNHVVAELKPEDKKGKKR